MSLSFNGEGKRDVRVSYVVENPIWKTSYRLVLSNKKDGKPMLQGWAVVENTSEEDWKDVRMALVSGRPISFQMDLYQPLYVPRPVVEPELFASLRPPTYQGAMEKQTEALAAKMPVPGGFAGGAPPAPPGASRGVQQQKGDALRDDRRAYAGEMKKRMDGDMDLSKGVASSATAGELGDFFQYRIDHPVTLPRQKSAMLPIVQKEVEAARVSIYNQNVQAKHPLLGLKFQNTTGMHLMQGPITVFEGSSYAGDTRILDIVPKDERLISYAIDLGTEVEPVAKNQPDRITKVKINKGIVYQTTRVRQEKTYNVKNRSEHDRVVLIEHPFRADFNLVSKDKPAERGRDVYRFELKVAAGQALRRKWSKRRTSTAASRSPTATTTRCASSSASRSSAMPSRSALTKALELKGKMDNARREIQQRERQLKDITDDQARLRANLKEMPPTAEAYKRYLKKLDNQETQIEKLQQEIKSSQDTEFTQRKAFEDYLGKLDVE